MSKDLRTELHALEREFGLPASEILDVINNWNRCRDARISGGRLSSAHRP